MQRTLFRCRFLAVFLSLLSLGLSASSSFAVVSEVRDGAGLFSSSTLQEANQAIERIQKDFHKDLLVETFPRVPEDRTAAYEQNREEFFSSFLRDRAMATRVDGIYVLVMKEPPPHRLRVQVGVGNVTRQRAFTLANREELVRKLQSAFRDDRFDDGLREGVAYVQRSLNENLRTPVDHPVARKSVAAPVRSVGADRETSSSLNFGSLLLIGLLIFGGLLVVRFFFRLLSGSATGGWNGAGSWNGGGGGGFFSGLLGGLGGALAGSWIYDHFFGSSARADDYSRDVMTDSSAMAHDTDYSSSGSDVGFDSGGDSFSSGGDVGGGDFGGGDFGGGGDA